MILLTPQIHARLLANGLKPDGDHAPVVKLFNPVGAATWLASELDEDGSAARPRTGDYETFRLGLLRWRVGRAPPE